MSYDIDLVVPVEDHGDGSITYEEVYTCNITFNLRDMAIEANLYDCLWNDKIERIAEDIIEPLEKGLELLKSKPEYFKKFNSDNGWGMYKHFVPYVEEYLNACREYPHAKIEIYK